MYQSAITCPDIKKDIFREFDKIARREGKSRSALMVELMEKYLKEHGSGNPAFTLENWKDPDFKPFPALASNYQTWIKYISKLNEKEREELKGYISNLDKALFSKDRMG